ncbi:DUF3131 domain-containing protein [Beggiatoa leptomitoformis]|uniref:DUF3131 domain-containing protein n=1 Tax=Beggiatoa leptomitoformis TaxID=288004 RepID=A0A2N9YIJ1_9GAMM|nr:DUF3131 domain-containing protein [Beggiatoa leptomitoformis]ALG67473.1 DUF3131 domain-containing protein [Beggiatoa leptomitoformis]AUI70310.1 DUF3131 domain-containing protein [Beggiatoa leptomitoformis]
MTFKEGLVRARSHIVFIIALLVSFFIVERLNMLDSTLHNPLNIPKEANYPLRVSQALSTVQIEQAQIAWQYFEKNYQAQTGLVNSADKYPSTTMWDTASYLMALISARQLEIISPFSFDQRVSLLLTSLARMPLFDNKLPNKSYNTLTLEMTDYNNHPIARGIGWSAIDIARLLVPFNILVWQYPQHTIAIQSVMRRFDFSALVHNGQMMGAIVNSAGDTHYVQEGRLGYEQYAAKSLLLLGLDVGTAANYVNFLKFLSVYHIDIPTDNRTPDQYDAHNYVVSESYILDGLEFGWDQTSAEFAYRVYQAQAERFKNTNILTAVSEDHIDEPPYFVYNTIFSSGKFWNTLTDKGEDASQFKSLSVKAVFGWNALYETDYTARLMATVTGLYDKERGWYAGLYEHSQQPNKALTANTNAIILESLNYQRAGKLVKLR